MAVSPQPIRGIASGFKIRLLAYCTFSMSSSVLLAQPDYVVSRILFEAHPIPETERASLTQLAEHSPPVTTQGEPVLSAKAAYSPYSFIDSWNAPVPADPVVDRDTAEAAIATYQDLVVDTEGEAGPFSADLLEQLLGLSQAYQQLDQHEEALATLEKADFISRINNGLYAPNQFTVVERMVESLLASGDTQEAMSKQQYLLYLSTQYYGPNSKQLVPALERLGDWSMRTFENGKYGSTSVGMVSGTGSNLFGFNAAGPRKPPPMSPRAQSIFNLELAQRRYYQAISNLLDSNDFHGDEILELEEKLLQSIYYSGHRNGLMKDPSFYLDARVGATGSRISHPEFQSNSTSYVNGHNALRRTLIYLESNANADPIARIVTLLNLADWDALFNRMWEAEDYYQQAWALAQTLPERRNEWEPLMAPDVPRQLPDFIALPHSRATFGIADDATVSFDGYIDVELDISRSGNVRNLRVLNTTDNVTQPLAKRLRRLLRGAPFRPELQDGIPVAVENKVVRYYFADLREGTPI